MATAKGLFAGAISVRRKDGIVIESSEDSEVGIAVLSIRDQTLTAIGNTDSKHERGSEH